MTAAAHTFVSEEGALLKRTPCDIYTRVMGYHRPVSHYNTGKKSEFYSRTYFTEEATGNSVFCKKFS